MSFYIFSLCRKDPRELVPMPVILRVPLQHHPLPSTASPTVMRPHALKFADTKELITTTLRVQFVESYWPDLVYNTRREHSDGFIVFKAYRERDDDMSFPPPHLKLDKRLGRGDSGQTLNGTVFAMRSGAIPNVVAKLFIRTHMDFVVEFIQASPG